MDAGIHTCGQESYAAHEGHATSENHNTRPLGASVHSWRRDITSHIVANVNDAHYSINECPPCEIKTDKFLARQVMRSLKKISDWGQGQF